MLSRDSCHVRQRGFDENNALVNQQPDEVETSRDNSFREPP